ncbi:MAG: hypothetical protein ABJF10_29310 [Chthoniobacter sp.]|uniref:hypothetical protein n=1 Tax=Chthoniobacter sp. TaxID=2510640 RepID=UPI0032A68E31
MSNPNRCGKIARLPKPVREEINQRLDAGATAKSLVPWLNGLPEVQAFVRAEFDGHPVSEHNLSQWKNGGYQDWLRYQEALILAEHLYEHGEELKAKGQSRMPMTEVLNLWMTSRLVRSTREIESMEGEAAWRRQRQFCTDLMKMRRAEHEAERLQIEHERTELQRQKLHFQREQAEMKRRASKRDGVKKQSSPEAGVHSAPRHPDASAEEKIAGVPRPENLVRISPLLTEAQKEARWREILDIPHPTQAAA